MNEIFSQMFTSKMVLFRIYEHQKVYHRFANSKFEHATEKYILFGLPSPSTAVTDQFQTRNRTSARGGIPPIRFRKKVVLTSSGTSEIEILRAVKNRNWKNYYVRICPKGGPYRVD